MPYIKSAKRRRWIDDRVDMSLTGVGELNYAITRLISNYLGPEMDYARLNNITGVLHDVAVEFDRRVVAPYEDMKKEENGDVYPDNQLSMKKDKDFRKFIKRIDEGEETWDCISEVMTKWRWPSLLKTTKPTNSEDHLRSLLTLIDASARGHGCSEGSALHKGAKYITRTVQYREANEYIGGISDES